MQDEVSLIWTRDFDWGGQDSNTRQTAAIYVLNLTQKYHMYNSFEEEEEEARGKTDTKHSQNLLDFCQTIGSVFSKLNGREIVYIAI